MWNLLSNAVKFTPAGATSASSYRRAVHLSLPLLHADHVAAVDARTAGSDGMDETVSLPSLRDVRVVEIDDEPDAREVVAVVLGGCGADVALVAWAEEALALLDRSSPHVLVCDIAMPGLTAMPSCAVCGHGVPQRAAGRPRSA
jgi:PleD family two-component response regulator